MTSASTIPGSALALALLAACAKAPPVPATALPPAAADLMDAVAFVQAVHPNPWVAISPEAFDAVVAREVAALPADADAIALTAALHRVLATLSDQHIRVMPPGFETLPPMLPLLPTRAEGKVWVDAALVQVDGLPAPLPAGTELLAVDGEPVEELWDDLSAMVMSDSTSAEVRAERVEAQFPILHYLARGPADAWTVRVREPDGEEQEMVLRAAPVTALAALSAERHALARRGGPTLARAPSVRRVDSAVVLRLPGFALPDPAFVAGVAPLMAELRSDDALLIDLRGNLGGFRTQGMHVLDRVLDAPYRQWKAFSTRVDAVPEPWADRTEFLFGDASALEGPFRGVRRREGRWRREDDPLVERMRPAGPGHPGAVVFLVDSGTASAAVEMVVTARAARPDVRVVGTETSGGCARHAGEVPVIGTTPNLGVRVFLSLYDIEMVPTEGCVAGRGVVPDVLVTPTIADDLDHADPFLEAALELVQN